MIAAVASILREIDLAGFATSVYRMGDYVELHAIPIPDGGPLHLARVDCDSPGDVYLAACALARAIACR